MDYRLYAVKKRPTSLDVPLFHAPFPNVYNDGRICWGSVPKVSEAGLKSGNLTEDWQWFFGTHFNSHGVQGKSRLYADDIRKHWLALSERGARTYPKRDLCPTRKTIQQILEGWK